MVIWILKEKMRLVVQRVRLEIDVTNYLLLGSFSYLDMHATQIIKKWMCARNSIDYVDFEFNTTGGTILIGSEIILVSQMNP